MNRLEEKFRSAKFVVTTELTPPKGIDLSEFFAKADALKSFLHRNLYRHPEVMRMTTKAGRIVRELFAAFHAEPRLLPLEHCARVEHEGPRAIADYIAGMTDRYAIREHRRLFAVGEF